MLFSPPPTIGILPSMKWGRRDGKIIQVPNVVRCPELTLDLDLRRPKIRKMHPRKRRRRKNHKIIIHIILVVPCLERTLLLRPPKIRNRNGNLHPRKSGMRECEIIALTPLLQGILFRWIRRTLTRGMTGGCAIKIAGGVGDACSIFRQLFILNLGNLECMTVPNDIQVRPPISPPYVPSQMNAYNNVNSVTTQAKTPNVHQLVFFVHDLFFFFS